MAKKDLLDAIPTDVSAPPEIKDIDSDSQPSGLLETADYLIELIRSRPNDSIFVSVTEALYMSNLPTLRDTESSLWRKMENDKRLQFEVQRRVMQRKIQLRNMCENIGMKGNDKMMGMALKLLSNDEELARLGGGNISLTDVRGTHKSSESRIKIVLGEGDSKKKEKKKQLAPPPAKRTPLPIDTSNIESIEFQEVTEVTEDVNAEVVE